MAYLCCNKERRNINLICYLTYLKKEKRNNLEKHVKGYKAFLHLPGTLMKERHRGLKTVYFRNRTENGAEARAGSRFHRK